MIICRELTRRQRLARVVTPTTVHLHTTTKPIDNISDLPTDQPLHIRHSVHAPLSDQSAASRLFQALRTGEHRVVDIEVGSIDGSSPGGFEHVSMPLRHYLDWLENLCSGRNTPRCVDGRQVYLAQWCARDEIEEVRRLIRPRPLDALLAGGRADLYQSALFLGPTGVTPLHFDPYMNLYHLQASSDPSKYAKHFTLLPASEYLCRPRPRESRLHNVSSVQLRLRRRVTQENHHSVEYEVHVESRSIPSSVATIIASEAISCVLREGDTLLVPRGWWHRTGNVCLDDVNNSSGWTAGVSWWFLPRDEHNTIVRKA